MSKYKAIFIFVFMLLMTGCYGSCVSIEIEANQRGIDLNDGVNPTKVLEPGRHSNSEVYASYEVIDVGVKTFDWNDPSLVTKDKQPIGLTLSVSVERPTEQEALFSMFSNYKSAATDDGQLQALVFSRVPRVAKGVASSLSLDELLGRNEAQGLLFDALQVELKEFGVILRDVGISDIQVSAEYTAALEKKAASQIAADIARQDALKLEQELEREKRQTDIDLEKARRENQVAEEKAKVYNANPYALELERLRVMAEAIKDNDKMFFIPQGSNLNMFFTPDGGTSGTALPLIPTQPVTTTIQ
jgi:regulator of protease activity HflC (stomatin/prohibitin superfamily)